MCGIFGYIGNKINAGEIVLNGLRSLEYRGYDSWGVAALKAKADSREIIVKKKTGMIGDTKVSDLPLSNFALGHTRWATHGGVTDINAHPHLDCSGQFAIIHNGIIENYYELKQDLLLNRHKIISETDTEVAVHTIEENYNNLLSGNKDKSEKKLTGLFLEAVRRSFIKFTGLNAIIVMDLKSKSMVAAKNGSPLVIGKGNGENFLASDAHALSPYTNNVFFMEDDQLVLVTDSLIEVFDPADGHKLTPKFERINWGSSFSSSKGTFAHFMLKEIYDQPKILRSITGINKKVIEDFALQIKNSYGTYFVGCGTAAYACLAGTYIFSKIASRHVNFAVGSEFGYLVDFISGKSLVVALSQSGETIDVIEALKKARTKGATIGALTNVIGSTLYRMADIKIPLGAGVEKAVVSTKAFTAKLAYLYLLAYHLAGKYNAGQKMLHEAISASEEILSEDYQGLIKKIIQKIYRKEHLYVIGRGLSYPIALETALKIKESSYLHAEGFAAGELKHGVIALIEKGTPCIAFLQNDDSYGANLAGAMELKARGGYIIGISHKNHEEFDYYLPIKDCGLTASIPSVIIGQLIGYYLALFRKTDPDKPRNLAKSVTVK